MSALRGESLSCLLLLAVEETKARHLLAPTHPDQAQAAVGELGPRSEVGLSVVPFLLQLLFKGLF